MTERFEHGGNLRQAMRNGATAQNLLDFSANINPLGLSPSVRSAIEENISDIIHYPDAQGVDLKEAISKAYNIQVPEITLGNGAVELIYVLCHVLRPQRVFIPAPTFSEYERAARAVGAQIHHHMLSSEKEFHLDLSNFSQELRENDMVFIGNPNNPTGTLLDVSEIENIVKAAKELHAFVIVDESFLDFLEDRKAYTAKHLIGTYDNLLVLHSLTKFYAIPGLRLGFSVTNATLTRRLHAAKDPWNVNSLSHCAGIAALKDLQYQQNSRRFLSEEKKNFFEALKNLPYIKPYPPTVNFILLNISATKLKSQRLQTLFLNEGILIRDCANYPGLSEEYVRFAVKAAAENKRLIIILKKILAGGENDKNYFNSSRADEVES